MGTSSLRLFALASVAACALGAACGSATDASFGASAPGGSDAGNGPSDGFEDGGGTNTGAASPQGPAASGVVLVHAAAFPAFRLCFELLPDLQPQPDSKVMPDANVVGVEVGSVVRIDPLDTPGAVYVIDQHLVQTTPGTTGKTCGELICGPNGGASCLRKDRDYSLAGRIDQPIGKSAVEVMAITGCGNMYFLGDVGASQSDCPAPYDASVGNLAINRLTLPPLAPATKSSIPVQLVHMSYLLDKAAKAAGDLDVKFGTLATGPAISIAHDPTLYQGGNTTTLAVDQTNDATYAQQGFRVAIKPPDGGAPTFSTDLSLADVQALSSPRDIPSSYYTVASNYALILLGDPRLAPSDPNYDPRRGVHLLAVPVLDPTQLDAGSGAEGGGDASGDR